MEFAYKDTSTERDWTEWHGRNVSLEDGGVEIAAESLPSFVAPNRLLSESLTGVVDIDIDACGLCFLLVDSGAVYQYDGEYDRLDKLDCVAVESGDPRAIAVTSDTIYVATTTRIRALSRTLLQRRWDLTDGIVDPVAMTQYDNTVYVLDARATDADGLLLEIHRDATTTRRVTGLDDPRDLALDTSGNAYVLDHLLQPEGVTEDSIQNTVSGDGQTQQNETGDAAEVRSFAVKRYPTADLEGPSARQSTDDVWISPDGFRTIGGAGRVSPAAIAVAGDGELVAGLPPDAGQPSTGDTGADTGGDAGSDASPASATSAKQSDSSTWFLLRYRPDVGAFERQVSFRRACDVLQYHERDDERTLYAFAGARRGEERAMYTLSAVNRTLRNQATGGFDAQLVRRVDAGITDVQWHRVTSSLETTTAGTQVRLSYAATDDDDLFPPILATDDPIPDVDAVDGIGPTYASRLESAGVTDVAALADREPRDISAIVSVETLDVSEETAQEWQAAAADLMESVGPDADVELVEGIGPTYSDRLHRGGVDSVEELVALEPTVLAPIVSRSIVDVSLERAAEWRVDAERLTPDRLPVSFDWQDVERPNPKDALLDDATGRYLWLKLELVGTEDATPRIESFRAYLPRQSYLRYLPEMYREDPASAAFLERFLSLFESVNADIEAAIGELTRYLDVDGVPAAYLGWLTEWLALEADENWPTAARRRLLDEAPSLYKQRGTRRGLERVLAMYLDAATAPTDAWAELIDRQRLAAARREGHGELDLLDRTAFVLEHGDLDCIEDENVRADYETLIPCSQCFAVLVRPWVDDDAHRTVERLVDAQQPAHTVGRAVHLQSWAQLTSGDADSERGHHAYLGVNTMLPNRELVLEESILGTDSTLGDHEFDGQYDIHARLGTDTFMS